MDSIKKIILFNIPTSICNLRCHYCYLAQRGECYQGVQPEMKYTPEQVAEALRVERIGGKAYMNFCADGETLLTKDIDKYVKALVQQGHYAEVVSNMTVTPMIDRFLQWEPDLLTHLEFKCSFHYLELKERNLLEVFADNVKKVWAAGASANIEITPSDELIPYLDEVKAFSLQHFGALPHLTIARDDRTEGIDYLTSLSDEEYQKVWEQFDSDFWRYKRSIFGVQQKKYCYAGCWSLNINLASGYTMQCYTGFLCKDIFADPHSPLPEKAVGACPLPHCYNGHALLTLGLIPNATDVKYGEIRNRVRADGTQWLQPELLKFFNTKLEDSNQQACLGDKAKVMARRQAHNVKARLKQLKKDR